MNHGRCLNIALLLAALAPGLQAQAAEDPLAHEKEARSRMGSILLATSGGCPLSGGAKPEAAGLIAPLVAVAADFAVGWVGQRLQSMKDDLNGQFAASGTTLPLSQGAGSGCLILYRGIIDQSWSGIKADGFRTHISRVLQQQPAFYLEAALSRLSSKPKTDKPGQAPGIEASAYSLSPTYLHYGLSAAKRKGKGRKHMTLAIALSGRTPKAGDVSDDKDAPGVFRFDFGQLQVGRTYKRDLLATIASVHAVTEALPLNATALVTESENPGPALEALISAFTSNKDSLSGAIEAAVKDAIGKK